MGSEKSKTETNKYTGFNETNIGCFAQNKILVFEMLQIYKTNSDSNLEKILCIFWEES